MQISAALDQAQADSRHSGASPSGVEKVMNERLTNVDGLNLDYAVVVNSQSLLGISDSEWNGNALHEPAVALIAAKVGTTRLIDNQILGFRSHNQTR